MSEEDKIKWKYGNNHLIASSAHPMTDKRLNAMEFVNNAAHTRASVDHIILIANNIIDAMDKITYDTLYSLINMDKTRGRSTAHQFIKEMVSVLSLDNKTYAGKENVLTTQIIEIILLKVSLDKSKKTETVEN
jgi:hypothetical protein